MPGRVIVLMRTVGRGGFSVFFCFCFFVFYSCLSVCLVCVGFQVVFLFVSFLLVFFFFVCFFVFFLFVCLFGVCLSRNA